MGILWVIVAVLAYIAFDARKAVKALENRVRMLENGARVNGPATAPDTPRTQVRAEEEASVEDAPDPVGDQPSDTTDPVDPWTHPQPSEDGVPRGKPARRSPNWEHLLGVRLPVWGGAALMIFAAFLFANYAMEQGFFTPVVRVWACGLGALLLLAGAFFVRWRRIANGERIASALAAASIAAGFATFYLATAVFALVPPIWGTIGSCAVALGAIAIALIFGRSVLILGLLGGYLSPGFIDVMPEHWVLLSYLATVLLSSHAVAARKGWWTSALLSSVLALLFAIAWASVVHGWTDRAGSLPLTIWLVAIAAVPVLAEIFAPLRQTSSGVRTHGPVVAALGSALFLVFLGTAVETGLPYWQGFLAWVAILVVASLWHPRRSDLTAVAMVGYAAMLLIWRDPDPITRIWVLIPSLVLLLGGAAVHTAAARSPRFWASAAMATLIIGILSSLVDLDGWAGARDMPVVWAIISLLSAALLVGLIVALRNRPLSEPVTPPLAAGVSGLVSIAIGLLVDPGYYALSAALQIAGLGLVFWRYGGRLLPYLALVYLGAYLVLMTTGHAIATGYIRTVASLPYGEFIPSAALDETPFTTLILPGLALLIGATFFSLRQAIKPARAFDVTGVLVIALGVHHLFAPLAESNPIERVFVFGALWFPVQFAIAAAALLAASRYGRRGLLWGGTTVAVLAALALVQLAIVPIADFWPEMEIPGIVLFNLATVTLGLSAVLLLAIGRWIKAADGQWSRWTGAVFQALAGISLFVLMLVTIRHGFHPDRLQGLTSGLERYAYTAGMLAFSFALLWLGAARDAQAVRIASLGVALATVAKLFVFDMEGLEGLWRIGSFLGLGLALLAVSWFYARFVFAIGKGPQDADQKDDTPEASPA